MKGEGCPGRCDIAVVVHLVYDPEYCRLVHPAVKPVIISFMQEHGDEQRKGHPPKRILVNVEVNKGIALLIKK